MRGRLDKVIAACCLKTRSGAQQLIRAGRVAVDGAVCKQGASHVDTDKQNIALDGTRVQGDGYAYVLLHKPAGVVSATRDNANPPVLSLLPDCYQTIGLGVVGRLDIDTEGLLLLTNNGALAHRLTSPRHHVPKRYLAELEVPPTAEDVAAFAAGMDLGDFVSLPAQLEYTPGSTTCHVVLLEGKFHQVKRMFAARGNRVVYLKRVQMGPLVLEEDLKVGQWRPLQTGEIAALLEGLDIV